MEEALASEGCDLVGIGRPACIYPDAARATILNPQVPDADARLVMEEVKKPLFTKLIPARATGSGVETVSILSIFSLSLSRSFSPSPLYWGPLQT